MFILLLFLRFQHFLFMLLFLFCFSGGRKILRSLCSGPPQLRHALHWALPVQRYQLIVRSFLKALRHHEPTRRFPTPAHRHGAYPVCYGVPLDQSAFIRKGRHTHGSGSILKLEVFAKMILTPITELDDIRLGKFIQKGQTSKLELSCRYWRTCHVSVQTFPLPIKLYRPYV